MWTSFCLEIRNTVNKRLIIINVLFKTQDIYICSIFIIIIIIKFINYLLLLLLFN